ncbi:hypothetical protein K2O51_31145 (plasmid) [Cupriavidus pinatubonensis]|uniref:hypothetical protein n=1 Tax=Cupriavidus pinatubonensis TaxID=248026 RepID=UPI001C733991|nr:hypothetical protein [Cupriavidus pinatubonensis]QYY33703.1 hypothetical protein K2O51_31145 [Cupriavidus pinatubonensis]
MQASSIRQLANSMQWRLTEALRERDAAAAERVCADLRRLNAEIERLNTSAGAVRTLIAQERDLAWQAANPKAQEEARAGRGPLWERIRVAFPYFPLPDKAKFKKDKV